MNAAPRLAEIYVDNRVVNYVLSSSCSSPLIADDKDTTKET